jgi:outer membrane receptor protein involved in Fe transport
MKNAFRAALLASVAASGMAVPHFAMAADAASVDVEELVVTGSRIRRDTFNAPVPVQAITSEQIRQSGAVSVADILLDVPTISANTNGQNSSGTLYLSGQARADIRGLGATRTLVLMDGKRLPFSDASSPGVDLNMIPSLMIERADVQPGGSSAVYGSEAIAGVLNFIMKKSYDGFQIDAQAGTSAQSDGQEWRLGGLFGKKLMDDKLNVLIGGEISRTEPIMQKDRDWAYPGIRRNTLATPQTIIPNSKSNVMPTATFQLLGGALGTARAVTLDYRNPTSVVRLSPACSTPTVQPTCQDDALIYTGQYNALQGKNYRGIGRIYADYAVTDRVKVYGDFMYSRVDGYGIFQPPFSSAPGGGTMPVSLKGDNAYLAGATSTDAALRAEWLAAGKTFTQGSTAQVGKFWVEFGGRDVKTSRETTRYLIGAQGDFDALDRKVYWEGYAQFGKTTGSTTSYNVPNVARVQQATDAVVVGGQIVCRDVTARAAGCVPWNLVDGASAAAIAWTNAQSTTDQEVKQTVVGGNVNVDLFKLPAGPVGFAMGAEYRKEESFFAQDALGASGALFFNAIGTRQGDYDVKEAYAELRVPVLKDVPFAKELSFEFAGRSSDYSSIGRTDQYTARVEWRPFEDLTIRANQGTAVRAPNIVELYSPQSVNFTTLAVDPCDKDVFRTATAAQQAARRVTCAAAISGWNSATFVSNIGTGRASLQLLNGGNPNLGAETADTYQVGFVATPHWVPGLKMSLDFFKYNIADQVGTIPVNTLFQNLCYDSSTAYASNEFCKLIVRDATGTNGGAVPGGVTVVSLTNQNVAKVKVEGYDGSIEYAANLEDWFHKDVGTLAFRADATWMYKWALQGLPGQSYTQLANTINNATPEWKGSASVRWTYHDVAVTWTTHYIGSMISTNAVAPSALSPYYTGDYYNHDIRVSYKLDDKVAMRAGILNLTDETPPYLPETYTGTGTGSSTFDNRGRFFYVGATLTY